MICSLQRILGQFCATTFERDLREAIENLREMLPDGVSVRLDAITDLLSVLPSTHAEYDPGSFCTLLRAIIGQRRRHIVNWTAGRNARTNRDFDPNELSFIRRVKNQKQSSTARATMTARFTRARAASAASPEPFYLSSIQ